MPGDPHEVMRKVDQKLLEEVEGARRFAFSEGAIPAKYKLLIAMAIDASHGASGGVRALAEAAMRAGATKEEIGEALRVAFYISGCGSFYTAAEGLSNIIG
ncbi:MAG: carboxymuconolactone decarboxylase family protein [Candidatus Methanosuratincola sp.]|jgi:alkylhydroperoxidase/carboxymuconolactone decarboxylase family protein YurZ